MRRRGYQPTARPRSLIRRKTDGQGDLGPNWEESRFGGEFEKRARDRTPQHTKEMYGQV